MVIGIQNIAGGPSFTQHCLIITFQQEMLKERSPDDESENFTLHPVTNSVTHLFQAYVYWGSDCFSKTCEYHPQHTLHGFCEMAVHSFICSTSAYWVPAICHLLFWGWKKQWRPTSLFLPKSKVSSERRGALQGVWKGFWEIVKCIQGEIVINCNTKPASPFYGVCVLRSSRVSTCLGISFL